VLVAVALAGCGGDGDGDDGSAPKPQRYEYALFSELSLGTKRAVVERRIAPPSEATNEEFAVDDRERESCAFYLLTKDNKNAPDAIRLCYDKRDRLESTSTVARGREAPDEPAGAGPRDNSIGEPLPGGGQAPPPQPPPQP
jgi:hypothetical protein